jgi:UDP-2,3-diacylglucosamine pyrophosphatase LpxH
MTQLVFLSDVHIGSNAVTNWYQREVHEELLVAMLDHVVANAANVAELVIAGDLVDQWTYVPSERPPTLETIAQANPAIFAAHGALARVASALPGRVTFLAGNHDMALTAEALSAMIGQAIRAGSSPIYEPPAGRGQVVCTHGHLYSLFNAPDPVGDPANALPLGHFITRLCALDGARRLAPGRTVADLPLSGDPTGTSLLTDSLKAAVQTFVANDVSLSRVIMETFLDAVGETTQLAFQMGDGSSRTAEQVIQAYEGLYARFGAGPRSLYGIDPSFVALLHTDANNSLQHFAEVLAARYAVIVMGHTHACVDDADTPLFAKDYLYANPGFGCPSLPDMQRPQSPARSTFLELEVDEARGVLEASVRYATSQGTATVAPTPLSPPRSTTIRR